jgi:hypothetical protein
VHAVTKVSVLTPTTKTEVGISAMASLNECFSTCDTLQQHECEEAKLSKFSQNYSREPYFTGTFLECNNLPFEVF